MSSIDKLVTKVIEGSSVKTVLEGAIIEASQCHKYRADTDTCSTGCKQSKIDRGGSCPWSDDWDEASKSTKQGGCYCYG